ncbi:hypothetical protein BZA05DRAFT_275993 [Tricharina praecox]|uniref:uncharacterized protein n=1 Tax=Tricharina praecox TaxID=43433 RepID=UPI0022201BF8|nr:uncharacterized protein BZA05DRAFT_275993 [Tricharina praecox]KAI5853978.1 hypothetical protein BZA05DRAFT_275993 [Tricharina praecox]
MQVAQRPLPVHAQQQQPSPHTHTHTMPAATTKRKSKAAGLDVVENGIGGGKENSSVVLPRKKRDTAAGNGSGEKKPAKKRKKDLDTDGDFQFRRRKSTRLATRAEAAAGASEDATVIATPEELAAPATTARTQRKAVASVVPETPVVRAKPVSLPLDSPTPPPPRATRKKKEKRREENGDAVMVEKPASPPLAPTTRSRKPDKRRRNEKTAGAATAVSASVSEHDASVDDSYSRKIQLPTSDTPMQRRNQELRKGSGAEGSSRRRSSLGMRGRRASSMMQSGLVGMT